MEAAFAGINFNEAGAAEANLGILRAPARRRRIESKMSENEVTILSAAVAGIFGLAGVILGYWLSGRTEHKQFLRDSKAKEYRDLLDTLGGCIREVRELKGYSYVYEGGPFDPIARADEVRKEKAQLTAVNNRVTSALLTASQAIDDRLFIRRVLAKHDVKGDWRNIEKLAERPGAGQSSETTGLFNVTDFNQAWKELWQKIVGISESDI